MFSNHCSCGVLSGSPNRSYWSADGGRGGVWMRNTSDGCQEHLNMLTSAAWCHLLNKLGRDLCERFFLCDAIESELVQLLQFLSFTFLKKQKPFHFNAPAPPFCFSCLWTSALRASVSRHKPGGDTLSSILRYMVLNEERAAKETACLHINTLCDCSVPFQAAKLLVSQWCFWCTLSLAD